VSNFTPEPPISMDMNMHIRICKYIICFDHVVAWNPSKNKWYYREAIKHAKGHNKYILDYGIALDSHGDTGSSGAVGQASV